MKFDVQESAKLFDGNSIFTNLTFFLLATLIYSGNIFAQPPGTIQKTKSVKVSPEQLSSSFAEVAKKVEPAVVNIDTKGRMPSERYDEGGDEDDALEYLRRNLPRRPSYAVGSGFIVDRRGYILTNYHVVKDSARITVRLQSGEEYTARIIGADDETDLAVLKIDAKKTLPYLQFGNSDNVNIGDWVLAIGSPFGLAQTVTAGIISQTNRETPTASPFQKFLQTDAAINRGNSGGPLVDMTGRVIGVNSQIATSTGDYNGIGFALPSKEAFYVYDQIIRHGKVRRGFLGVALTSVKPEFAEVYGISEAKGAIITQVVNKDGAAAKAGLQKDDIVVAVNGKSVKDRPDLISKIASIPPGQEVGVTFYREAEKKLEKRTIVVKLSERPTPDVLADDNSRRKLPVGGSSVHSTPFGLTLAELTPQLARSHRLRDEEGVLIRRIDPASFVADVKAYDGDDALKERDLIQRINRVRVKTIREFTEVANKLTKGSAVVLHISRYNRRRRRIDPLIVQFRVK